MGCIFIVTLTCVSLQSLVLLRCWSPPGTCRRPPSPWSGSALWRPTGRYLSIPSLWSARRAPTQHIPPTPRSPSITYFRTRRTTSPSQRWHVKARGLFCCCSCTLMKEVGLDAGWEFNVMVPMEVYGCTLHLLSFWVLLCASGPMSPPRNLTIYNHTDVSVWLSWEPPSEPNGVVIQYGFRTRDLITHTVTHQVSLIWISHTLSPPQ